MMNASIECVWEMIYATTIEKMLIFDASSWFSSQIPACGTQQRRPLETIYPTLN